MPRLSDTMERGTIARWLEAEGDTIATATSSPRSRPTRPRWSCRPTTTGCCCKILVGEGESAELGAPIALVGEEGEEPCRRGDGAGRPPRRRRRRGGRRRPRPSAAAEPRPAAPPSAARGAPSRRAGQPAAPSGGDGTLRASPMARRMAGEAGIDLRVLAGKGSGPEGRIVRIDVERADRQGRAPARRPRRAATAPRRPRRQAGCRGAARGRRGARAQPMLKVIARRMAESKGPVPHFYLETEVEMTRAAGAAQGAQHGAARRRRQGLRDRPDRARLRAGAASSSRRRTARGSTASSSTTRGQHRRGRGARRRADRARDQGRRRPGPARDLARRARDLGRARPGRAAEGRPRSRAAPSPSRTSACSASRVRGHHQPARARDPRRRGARPSGPWCATGRSWRGR